MTLYEIADDIKALMQLADRAVDEETGEPVPLTDGDRATVEQWFAESKDNFDAKLENYGRFMKNL
ncbi:MAG: siphovirus Gp157 family protein, partial [Spirochaetaceae bacterium]|nr:siphovirus Gp157 family protein [Spirochaetaceae bacterium]